MLFVGKSQDRTLAACMDQVGRDRVPSTGWSGGAVGSVTASVRVEQDTLVTVLLDWQVELLEALRHGDGLQSRVEEASVA